MIVFDKMGESIPQTCRKLSPVFFKTLSGALWNGFELGLCCCWLLLFVVVVVDSDGIGLELPSCCCCGGVPFLFLPRRLPWLKIKFVG